MKTASLFASLALAATLLSVCPGNAAAQQGGGNNQEASEARGPFRGGFLRRLRDDLRGDDDEKEKEKQKKPGNPDGGNGREPTPAQRPNQIPGYSVDRPMPGSGRLPGDNAPGFRLSDAGAVPLPGSPQPAPESGASQLPTPPREGFGVVLVDRDEKLFVRSVEPRGNAAEAGLERGDQVLKAGGAEIGSIAAFDEITGILKPGDMIELIVARDDEEKTIQLQFGSTPPVSDEAEGPPLVADNAIDWPAPDFVPGGGLNDSLRMDDPSGLGSEQPVGSGTSVLRQPALPSDPGVAELQQTILQQQQVIRQLQQDVELLRQQLQGSARQPSAQQPRNSQSGRRRN
jgi:hypothetical protein